MPNPVIEAYKRHIDRTLIRENLKLSPEHDFMQVNRACYATQALDVSFLSSICSF